MLSAEALALRGNEDAGGAAPADDQSRLGCGRHPRQQRRNLARRDRQEDPARRHVPGCRDPLQRAPQALQLHHRQDRQGCCLRGRQSSPSHRQAKGVQGNVRELLIQGTMLYTMGAWHSSHTSQVNSYLLTALLRFSLLASIGRSRNWWGHSSARTCSRRSQSSFPGI